MNKVMMTVTLCNDPETHAYGDGKTLVSFRGAVNKRFKREGEADADFFKYVAFGKTAEFIEKYFKKGKKMLVIGEVNNNNYKDKDGKMVYGTQILIDSVEFFGKKSDDDNTNTNSNSKTDDKPSDDYYDAYSDF